MIGVQDTAHSEGAGDGSDSRANRCLETAPLCEAGRPLNARLVTAGTGDTGSPPEPLTPGRLEGDPKAHTTGTGLKFGLFHSNPEDKGDSYLGHVFGLLPPPPSPRLCPQLPPELARRRPSRRPFVWLPPDSPLLSIVPPREK